MCHREAQLTLWGSDNNPAIFTSYRDDSAGGDSDGGGASTGYIHDYITAIRVNGGSANISKGAFQFGYASVEGSCIGYASLGAIVVADSDLKSQTYFSQCGPGVISMLRNELTVPAQDIKAIYAGYSDVSGIVLHGTDANVISASSGTNVIDFFSSYIPSGESLGISSVSNAVIKSYDLSVHGTLNLLSGSVIKAEYSNTAIKVESDGALNVDGSQSSPVVFTSMTDDSVGGDSNSNGPSSGGSGGYGIGIMQNAGGVVNVSDANFKYAYRAIALGSEATLEGINIDDAVIGIDINGAGQFMFTNTHIANTGTGMTVMGGAKVIYRGSFTGIGTKAIVACKWTESCNVDASYTEWGSVTGPFVSGSSLACGNVVTLPWKHNGTTYNGEHVFISNCDNSITPQQAIDASIDNFQQRMGYRQIDCSGGYQPACEAMSNAIACLGAAVNLAGSTSPIPLPQIDDEGDIGTWGPTVKGSIGAHIRDGVTEIVLVATAGEVFSRIGTASGLLWSMANAYNQCAP